MALKSWPYANQATSDLEYGQTRSWRPSGVVADPEGGITLPSSLAVSANATGMVVQVAAGAMQVAGFTGRDTASSTVPIAAATTSPRIDTVIARLNLSATALGDRITITVKKGTAASSPVAPSLERHDTVWEEPLADVLVPANAVTIQASNVTDRRVRLGALPMWPTAGRPLPPSQGSPGGAVFGWNLDSLLFEWRTTTTGWSTALPTGNIPSLDGSKITTGTVALARIPTMDAAHIPNLDAAKITTGTLNADRLPTTLRSHQVSGTLNVQGPLYAGDTDLSGNLTAPNLIARSTVRTSIVTATNVYTPWVGVAAGSAAIGFGEDNEGSRVYSSTVYARTYSSAANMYITSAGTIGRSTSAARYKDDIRDADVGPDLFLGLRPRTWIDRAQKRRTEAMIAEGTIPEGWSVDTLPRHVGLVADEVADLPGGEQFVTRDEDGQVDALSYDRLIVAAHATVRAQQEQIEELTARVQALEARA